MGELPMYQPAELSEDYLRRPNIPHIVTICYSTKERDQKTHFMILSNVGNISTNSLTIYQLTRSIEISLLLLRKKYSICNIFLFCLL